MEIATFYVDNNWFGIPSEYVVEAIDASGITKVPGSSDSTCGYMMFRGNVIPVIGLWGIINKEARRRSSRSRKSWSSAPCRKTTGIWASWSTTWARSRKSRCIASEKISSMLAGNNLLAERPVKTGKRQPAGRNDRGAVTGTDTPALRGKRLAACGKTFCMMHIFD